LLVAAEEVFARNGYEYATLTDIAAEAGLSGGSIYNYFRGKPELFLEVVRRTLSGLSIKPLLADSAPPPGPELLSMVAGRLLGPDASRVRALIREVRYAAGHDGEVAKLFDEFHSDAIQDYSLLIRSWQEDGRAEPSLDADLVAQLFMAELLGLCHIELVRPPLDIAKLQPLVDAHLRGLLTMTTDRPRGERATRRAKT
jgi:AcrR family transcriptional regulator